MYILMIIICKNFIPVGFVALMPNLQQEEPFFPTAHTCPHGPHDILIRGWSLGICSHDIPYLIYKVCCKKNWQKGMSTCYVYCWIILIKKHTYTHAHSIA